MTRGSLCLLALAGLLTVAAGPDAWARLAWRAGFPGVAASLLTDPVSRGAALFEAGQFAAADAAFAAVGRGVTYNRGLSLAATGKYALSVAYFDAVLFADRYDADARHNREIVSALIEPVVGESRGHGRIRTLLTEAGVETEAFDPDDPSLPLLSAERDPLTASTKRPVTEERTVSAGTAWLDTLADAPGEYLKALLAGEMERRRAEGQNAAEEPQRW